jgi:glyoxylase I family protein
MSEVLGIQHVSFVVADVQHSLMFYREILHLEADPQRPEIGYPGAWLAAGMQQIHLLQLPNPDPVSGRPVHVGRDRHVALAVSNLESVVRRLEDAGISFTRSRSGRRAVFFRDPDGNGIELVEETPA